MIIGLSYKDPCRRVSDLNVGSFFLHYRRNFVRQVHNCLVCLDTKFVPIYAINPIDRLDELFVPEVLGSFQNAHPACFFKLLIDWNIFVMAMLVGDNLMFNNIS